MNYIDFLKSKMVIAPDGGIEIDPSEVNHALNPHQVDAVLWACKGGNRALFESFGLGKTVQELEFCRLMAKHAGGWSLIVLPLGVKQEFTRDATQLLGWKEPPRYVRTMQEAKTAMQEQREERVLLTNYERVRDGDIDPAEFTATSLDEASVLRSFGSKTYQTFLGKFKRVPYKMVATATPSPNRYKELIHYAGYLGIMDTGQALTRFFQRDSTKANNLTLYPHKEEEFWLWVSTWALFIQKPSDLGYDDTGYALPPMEVRYHRLTARQDLMGTDRNGQILLVHDAAISLKDAAAEKRDSIDQRVEKAKEIIDSDPDAHFIIWHDLEAERHAIKRAIPEAVEVYGTQDYDEREKRVIDFSEGRSRILATKKEISGQGCNFQHYCHRAIFLGVDYNFNDFLQGLHRIYRFLQTEKVIIDIIYMDTEDEILDVLKEKWKRHDELQERMANILRTYGMNAREAEKRMQRSLGVNRLEVTGKNYKAVLNDCIEETAAMPDNSVDLIVTSIPFSNHYEYTPSYNDLGHNEDTDKFFQQMDYLAPSLLRVLKPGRIYACHTKDRVLFGNATGKGMPTIEPFHALTIQHYMKHGFQYIGMITVVTDVVRENNQTYRLGWSEQCKDGSKMGVGCPEYILLFRKLPTSVEKAYADVPVEKSKEDYTRAQWQIDAHAFWRSSGDRLLTKEELAATPTNKLQKVYRQYSRGTVYDYAEHVALAKKLDDENRLPATFMVVAPGSWTDEVWDDITRMRTLNSEQAKGRRQLHVCLAEDTLVLTRNGYKPIQDVSVGDLVLTHQGRWKPVIAKAMTGHHETVHTKAQGVPLLITTPDHKLWTRTTGTYPSRPKAGMQKTEPAWLEAEKTVGSYINLKLPPVEPSDLSEDEWWLIGRYLADGHVGTRGDFFISVGKQKQREFEQKASAFIGSCAERETAFQYRLRGLSGSLISMLRKCGHGAENKQVPVEGLCLDQVKAESLLSGYLSGDGNKTGNATSASSVSRALLLGMSMVAQRARGVIASVFASKKAGKCVIEGREVNCKQLWGMSWRDSLHHHEGAILSDGAWRKVRQSIPAGERDVYSIQVADDASYTAEGCIVKNCPLQIDIVERLINRYSNPGETVYDPFGGLMTVPVTAVKMGRYGIGCELNADYFRDGVGYLEQADCSGDTFTMFDLMKETEPESEEPAPQDNREQADVFDLMEENE